MPARVGTGFDDADLEELSARFEKLARKDSPFDSVPREVRRGSKWVEPKLVAEIAFTEFTADGILRHPSFLGLARGQAGARGQARGCSGRRARWTRHGRGRRRRSAAGIRITSPDKVLFPEPGHHQGRSRSTITRRSRDLMLPHLGNRPLSLVRCPQGRAGKCFFQKHDTGGFPGDAARHDPRTPMARRSSTSTSTISPGSSPACRWACWSSTSGARASTQVEKPDRIVFDLDPDEGLDFERRAARRLRPARPARRHRPRRPFRCCRGGKGFHVIAPLAAAGGVAGGQGLLPRLRRAARRGRAGPLRRQHGEGASARAASSSIICATSAARRPSRPIRRGRAKAPRSRRRSRGRKLPRRRRRTCIRSGRCPSAQRRWAIPGLTTSRSGKP